MRPLLLCLLATLPLHALEPREWTDSLNRKIQATLVKVDGENVVLKMKDGREVPFPLAKLSQPDRDFVANLPKESPATLSDTGTEPEIKTSASTNFDAPWPERVTFTDDPEINTIEENATDKRFIYESANYRYTCDVRLSKTVVKGFAVMFEATNKLCAGLPLALNAGSPPNGKNQIILFEKKEDYVSAGGPPSSAGVYMSRNKTVMVPLESLGVRPVGNGYMLDRAKDNQTLTHELTHQLTPPPYYSEGSRGWFTEGLAEYVAASPYRSGSFNVRGNLRDIIAYATAYGEDGRGGRALGTKIKLPPLKDFMLQPYEKFTADPQINYGCGMLITVYFIQFDGDGTGKRLKMFLQALRERKNADQALAVLLDGRTFEQLEKEITKAWKSKGVDFFFTSSGG